MLIMTDRDHSRSLNTETEIVPVARVLIIEDEPHLGDLLRRSLAMINVQAYVENSGQRGVDAFFDLKPDCVLLDIGLPDVSGWRVLDYIKEARGTAKRPFIVVITAHNDPANRLMGKLQDVQAYLVKPFTPRDVQQVIGGLFKLSLG
jgi:two-component system OmpR family response regulator